MKLYRRVIRLGLIAGIAILAFVAIMFKVDDMTLSKGDIYEFNEGWVLTGEDGEAIHIEKLPYLGHSERDEVVIFENTIPEEYFGKTMAFLSADKEMKVWMDGELVYEFGVADERLFGHTPGSVYNFIDIPSDLQQGTIRMEMKSSYKEYAARVTAISVGDRDVLILNLLQDNLPQILINILIIICGIVFFFLFLIELASKQDTGGMQFLSGYCIVAALYYFIETKVLQIFYGNQTFYSVMVFLCVMLIPFFIALYYANGILGVYKKRFKVLLTLTSANIIIQLILQLTNLVDFMDMSYFSHGLIALTVLIVAKSYLDIRKENKDKSILIGMLGLLFMGIGGTIDIIRMYVVAVGDMGKFSRLGTACFSLIMLYQHFSALIKGYSKNVEENARLIKNEMEYVAKKNEQLEAANREAEEARQEAIAANAAKDKFLAHMSHEIRTPINAVLGMDTMILRESKEMHVKEYALDIQNAGQSLLSLINDILDFSKIESGKLEIISVEYDFSSLIHDISNMVKAKVESKKLELNIRVDETLPSKLLGDDVRLRQVLVNLLNNAVKYTMEGNITLKADGRVEGRNVILDFSVEDTGIGIKEEDMPKLFAEFQRIEEKRNRSIEGTGLGLSITTQLLGLMGSKLNVESEYGKGTKFFFTIKQQIVDSTPIGNLEKRIMEQSREYSYTAAFVAPNAKVLVVDDNLVNLKVFVNLLKPTRMSIDVVDRGQACLEMIAEKHYDLIFLDHMMPGMNGIETLHRMKELEGNKCEGSPVIALTANAITGAKEMYLAEGFDAFLSKPINPEKLEQMIIKLLPRELLEFDIDAETEYEEAYEDQAYEGADIVGAAREAELPMIDGIDWNYGLMHLVTQEMLISTVNDFYKILEAEADALDEFYGNIDSDKDAINSYRIKVHSMKSSANLIGATVIGGMAKLLEAAAKEEDVAQIKALHDIFINEWRSYKEKLKEVVGESASAQAGEDKIAVSDYSQIEGYLLDLKAAMEEMDIDLMDELMAKLEGFAYSEKIQSRITKLSAMVINMDSLQAGELIDEIIESIKKGEV